MALLLQFLRYGLSGSAAAATHVLVLIALVELSAVPATAASVLGFCCALPVNYSLQHRFVFSRTSQHHLFFPRYFSVTMFTMGLNAALFWSLHQWAEVQYVISQVITIGLIVPLNFILNRHFTFAEIGWSRRAIGRS